MKSGVSGIGTDDLIDVLQTAAPQVGIKFGNPSGENKLKLIPFIDALIAQMIRNHEDYLIEGDEFDFDHIQRLKENPQIKICFIGYKDVEIETKLQATRTAALKGDWTFMHSDDELKEILLKYKKKSVDLEKTCEEIGVKYFDTSNDYNEVLNKVIEYLSR